MGNARRMWGRWLVAVVMLGMGWQEAHALMLTSGRSPRPARNQTVQCLIRNETQRDIYVMPEWIECENDGTVMSLPGRELRPGESLNLSTSDGRACRCRATTNGAVSFGLYISTSFPDAPRKPVRGQP